MKEFNLEKAKLGHPICTREGMSVRILAFDLKSEKPLVVAIKNDDGIENVQTYGLDGIFNGDNNLSEDDLMMASVKHEGWINIYKNSSIDIYETGGLVYESEEMALEARHDYDIATIKIEWEE